MSFLQTLRGKSKEEKHFFALMCAAVVVVVIFLIWISVFMNQFSDGTLATSNTATSSKQASQQESSVLSSFFGDLKDQVAETYSNIRETNLMKVFDASVQYENKATTTIASSSRPISPEETPSRSVFATTSIESTASTTFDGLVKSLFESTE